MIVYGDDNGTSMPSDKFFDTWFSYHLWSQWLDRYWGMTLRDIAHRPFLSTQKLGWLTRPGFLWLRHYMIANPSDSPGQSRYVPFRETREYVIRAVHGREPRVRNLSDVTLSCIGHAYGTYGSNIDAYYFLHYLYFSSLKLTMVQGNFTEGLKHLKYDRDDVKKWRRMGLNPSDVLSGFPKLQVLLDRNVYREEYHDVRRIDVYDKQHSFFFD